MNTEKPSLSQKKFDPDLSPKHRVNAEAAVTKNMRFDEKKRSYVDQEGSLVLDKFGQPY